MLEVLLEIGRLIRTKSLSHLKRGPLRELLFNLPNLRGIAPDAISGHRTLSGEG
jgi:hypothetical protein